MRSSRLALAALGLAAACGTSHAQVYQSGFEGTDGGFVGTGDWQRGVPMSTFTSSTPPCSATVNPPPAAFEGSEVWGTQLAACHSVSQNAILSQTFDFTLLTSPRLLFREWQDTGGNTFDMCIVRVNGTQIYLGDGVEFMWTEQDFDLTAFEGQSSVLVEFVFLSTTGTNRSGWYIDDVRIEGDVAGPGVNYRLELTSSASNASPGVAACNVTFTGTVSNVGLNDATAGGTFSAAVPANGTFVSGSGSMLDMGNVTAAIPALASGAVHTFSFVLSADFDGTMTVSGNVTLTADTDTNPANNADSVDVNVSGTLANDNCCSATNLNMQTLPFSDLIDNSGATDGPDAGICGSATVGRADFWYVYTAPGAGVLTMTETSSQDIAWGVYNDCNSAAVSCLGTDTAQTVALSMGQTVYIQVAAATATTNITTNPSLTFDFIVAPANDECSAAEVIPSFPFPTVVANLSATDGGDIGGGCDIFGDVWYTWTATATGSVRANEAGTQTAEWGFYEGSDCNNLSLIRCTTSNTEQHIDVFSGTTYWFRVGASLSTTTRTTPLDLSFEFFTPPPANDNCSAAETIMSMPFSAQIDNQAATGAGDVAGCTNFSDVWYMWTATDDGTMLLNETDGQDAHWSVYEGSDCNSLFNILCTTSDTSQSVPVFQGNVYTIRVGTGSATATTRDIPLNFTISFQGAILNDTCATARNITNELPFSRLLANADASSDGDIAGCDVNNDVWYTYTASANGVLTFTETGSQGAEWGAYEGTDCNNLVNLLCTTTELNQSIPVTMGQTYKLRIGYDGIGTGSASTSTALNFTIDFFAAPTNDECSGAIVLDIIFGGIETIDARGAANDADIDCNGTAVEATAGVWYTFTTGLDPLILNINESSTATAATQFYTGSCGGLNTVPGSCSTTQNRFQALEANTTYYMILATSSATRPTVPFSFAYFSAVAPANDQCSGATVLDPNSFPQSFSVDASSLSNDTSDCPIPNIRSGHWFQMTATATAPLVINGTTTPDTDVAVYQANDAMSPSCSNVTFISCPTALPTVVSVVAGETYYFLVGDNTSTTTQLTGFFNTTFEFGVAPANDLCADAIAVTSLPFNDLQLAAFATDDTPSTCSANFFNGIWYSFVPSVSDDYFLSEGSTINAIITVYSAPAVDPCNNLSEVACIASGTSPENGFATLTAGTLYYINVSRESTTVPSATLNWNFSILGDIEPLSNDFCADAVQISATPFAYTTDNNLATADGPGGTCDAFTTGGPPTMQNSIWFVLTTATAGDLMVSSNGDISTPSYDSIVTVLDAGVTNDPCNAPLTEIACADNPDPSTIASVSLVAGNTYFILAGDNGVSELGGLTLVTVSYSGTLVGGSTPCPGDYNDDGNVDLLDLLAFNSEWSGNLGTTVPMGTLGDYDTNGSVDLLDLLAFNGDWSSNLGTPCP